MAIAQLIQMKSQASASYARISSLLDEIVNVTTLLRFCNFPIYVVIGEIFENIVPS